MTADWAFPPPADPGPEAPGTEVRCRIPAQGPLPAISRSATWGRIGSSGTRPDPCRRHICPRSGAGAGIALLPQLASAPMRNATDSRFRGWNGPKRRSEGVSGRAHHSRPPDHADKFGIAGGPRRHRCRRCRDDRIRSRRSGMTLGPPLDHPWTTLGPPLWPECRSRPCGGAPWRMRQMTKTLLIMLGGERDAG
jgi:hypothetical protein